MIFINRVAGNWTSLWLGAVGEAGRQRARQKKKRQTSTLVSKAEAIFISHQVAADLLQASAKLKTTFFLPVDFGILSISKKSLNFWVERFLP